MLFRFKKKKIFFKKTLLKGIISISFTATCYFLFLGNINYYVIITGLQLLLIYNVEIKMDQELFYPPHNSFKKKKGEEGALFYSLLFP